MVKNIVKSTHKTHLERFWGVFLVVLMVNLMSISFISAAEFDNVKTFDEKVGNYGKVTIKDWFGLQNLAELELKKNTDICGFACSMETEITMHQSGSLVDDIRFVGGGLKDYELYIQDGTKTIERNLYTESCENILDKNGTNYNKCNQTIIGTREYQEPIWKEYKLGTEVGAGTYNIKLIGTKKVDATIDWQITSQGKLIDDWALWTGTDAPIRYYQFNNSLESVDGKYNLTVFEGTPVYLSAGNLIGDYGNITIDDNWKTGGTPNICNGSTLNFWVYGIDNTDVVLLDDIGNSDGTQIYMDGTGDELEVVGFSNHTLKQQADVTSAWTMVTLMTNTSYSSLYINGTLYDYGTKNACDAVGSADMFLGTKSTGGDTDAYKGKMDELGIWNRSLTNAEITELYNSGSGISYEGGVAVSVTLNSPDDLQEYITGTTVTFNCSSSVSGSTLNNITLWHNGTGTWERNETKSASGVSDTVTFTKTPANDILWSCEAGAIDGTNGFASSNRSVVISDIIVNEEQYVSRTIEGTTNTFAVNVTISSGTQISISNLIYNSTSYSGSISNIAGDNYTLSKSIETPGVSANKNVTFYWQIELDDGSKLNSTSTNQQIDNLAIDDCSVYGMILLNLTLVDEIDQDVLTAGNKTVEVDVDIFPQGSRNAVIEYSQNYSENTYPKVCLQNDLNDSTYEMDVQIFYDADDYTPEFYYIQNFTLTNSTLHKNITLYDLDDDNSQEFRITYKDESFLAVSNALVQIQRKYVNEGISKTVEQPRTDANGETLAHLQLESASYTIVITKEGETLATFANIVPICQNPTLDPCEINLNSFASSISPEDYSVGDDFSFTTSYLRSTRVAQTIFTIPSGTPSEVIMNVTMFDNLGTTEACTDSLTSSSGTLTCTIPQNLGNGSAMVVISKGGIEQGWSIISLAQTASDIWGTAQVFISISLLLTLIGIGLGSSALIVGFFLILGMALLIMLNLINTGGYGTFIGAGATILWLIIAVVIILIKGAKRR